MYDVDYWRGEAVKLRELAERTHDPAVRDELLDLAAVCDEVADAIEARSTGG